MVAVIVQNVSDPDRPMEPPRKPDGSLYRWSLCFDAFEALAFSDDLSDLVSALIGSSYLEMAPADQLAARISYANRQQVWAQAQANVEADVSPSSVSPADYDVLMGSRDTQPILTEWSSPAPLVLLTTGYQPHTSIPPPVATGEGEIIWLDPATEESFLTSLHYVGAVGFATSQPS